MRINFVATQVDEAQQELYEEEEKAADMEAEDLKAQFLGAIFKRAQVILPSMYHAIGRQCVFAWL